MGWYYVLILNAASQIAAYSLIFYFYGWKALIVGFIYSIWVNTEIAVKIEKNG